MDKIISHRRFELDWLRVIAIFSVFVYHCSLVFAPDAYQIKNPVLYQYLDDIGWFAGLWGMPLILIISGASAFLALGKVSPGKYLKGLVARLLVPLLFGIFTHTAYQVYLENLHKGTFIGSFIEFYPRYFEGMYGFGGNFAWMGMHLWYLEALFIFSILCLPVFLWLKRSNPGQRTLQGLANFLSRPAAIYLFVLPTTIIFSLFDPDGLGTTVIGGWSIFNYLGFFISGFVIISSLPLQKSILRMRWVSLILGILTWPTVDLIWDGLLGDPVFGTWQFAIGVGYFSLCAWCWLLTIFGFAFKYLNREKPFIHYANQAVLPFYIMHQTVLLTVAYYVVQWDIPDLLKFTVILVSTFAIVMSLYEFLVRRHNLLRFLFGMKPLHKAQQLQSTETALVEPAHSL